MRAFVYGTTEPPQPAPYVPTGTAQASPQTQPMRLPNRALWTAQAPRTRAFRRPDRSRQAHTLRTHRGGRISLDFTYS